VDAWSLITGDSSQMRTALTIAGSDSSGGAGIQADLKTFAALGVFGCSAITAVTAQNTLGVSAVAQLDPSMVVAQIDTVLADLEIHATKIGMLASEAIVSAVADAVRRHRLSNVVVDPVMVSKSGARLLDQDAVDAMRTRLFPLSTIVTPNVFEAEALTGKPIANRQDQRAAAIALMDLGPRAVLVKGGHLDGPAVDVFHDGHQTVELEAERIDTPHTHGTGCTLSSAIAARLALGDDLPSAVRAAKAYVTRAIAQAPGLGHGHGPLQHFVK
jgi:hydroxymethylpyrimidine/phosphomethylpyrimidine kinase